MLCCLNKVVILLLKQANFIQLHKDISTSAINRIILIFWLNSFRRIIRILQMIILQLLLVILFLQGISSSRESFYDDNVNNVHMEVPYTDQRSLFSCAYPGDGSPRTIAWRTKIIYYCVCIKIFLMTFRQWVYGIKIRCQTSISYSCITRP